MGCDQVSVRMVMEVDVRMVTRHVMLVRMLARLMMDMRVFAMDVVQQRVLTVLVVEVRMLAMLMMGYALVARVRVVVQGMRPMAPPRFGVLTMRVGPVAGVARMTWMTGVAGVTGVGLHGDDGAGNGALRKEEAGAEGRGTIERPMVVANVE